MKKILLYTVISLLCITSLIGQIDGMEVFLNQDTGPGNGIAINLLPNPDAIDEILNVALDSAEPGNHRVFIRVRENNVWSHSAYLGMLTVKGIDKPDLTSGEYFFNEIPGSGNLIVLELTESDLTGNILSLPIGLLPLGINRLYFRVNDGSSFSHYQFLSFIVSPESKDIFGDLVGWQYFFPDESSNYFWNQLDIAPTEEFDETILIDITGFELGEHEIFIRLVDEHHRNSHYTPLSFDVFDDTGTSTREPNVSSGIWLFPNPTSGVFSVISDAEIINLKLWDITGKLIYSKEVHFQEFTVDSHILTKGIYLLGVLDADGTHIRKLIVE